MGGVHLRWSAFWRKREYLGHTVNFKTQKHFKDKKSHYVSEDNWVIFENTQDAIIDQDTFDTVQKLRANVRRYRTDGASIMYLPVLCIVLIVVLKCMFTEQAMVKNCTIYLFGIYQSSVRYAMQDTAQN